MELDKKLSMLRFLSRTHRSEFNERRKYEWKILFAVLLFYCLTVATIFKEEFGIIEVLRSYSEGGKLLCAVVSFALFLLLTVVSSFFIWGIHKANDFNKKVAQKAELAIDKLGSFEIIPSESYTPLRRFGPICQIIILAVFAITAGLLIVLSIFGTQPV